ncbi:MAG: LytTR family DNA-binding domain-containing protein [Bacteroidales bacterium]
MIRLLIIDDQQEARNLMDAFLRDYHGIEVVGKASSVDEAIRLTIDQKPDLVLLDIQMPGKDGFAYVEELKEHKLVPGIIFVSAFEDYALRAIKSAAFDYLIKPIEKYELIAAIDRYYEYLKRNESFDYGLLIDLLKRSRPERIRLNTRTGYFLADPEDIIYIEADGNYCLIKLASGKTETSTLRLGNIEKMFDNTVFIRISRSFIININHLSRVDRRANMCYLEHNGCEYKIQVPAKNIKLLDDRI